jgi:hypothetical protein
MINLLPPETKRAYYYAQVNTRLLKWILVLIVGIIGLVAVGTYGWINLHRSTTKNQAIVNNLDQTLTANHLPSVEQQILTISNDFSLTVKVLSQEVLFSKLLSRMAAAMPAGANLTALNITNTASGSGLDITAEATDYTAATQVQVNLSDPANGIFSKADLVSISCSSSQNNSSTFNSAYPCIVSLRAQFAPNNQFLFINQKAGQ